VERESAFQEFECQYDSEDVSSMYHFKIHPRVTGQAGNFHSHGPVTCNKSGDAIILHSLARMQHSSSVLPTLLHSRLKIYIQMILWHAKKNRI